MSFKLTAKDLVTTHTVRQANEKLISSHSRPTPNPALPLGFAARMPDVATSARTAMRIFNGDK